MQQLFGQGSVGFLFQNPEDHLLNFILYHNILANFHPSDGKIAV